MSIVCGGTDNEGNYNRAGQVILRMDTKVVKGFRPSGSWHQFSRTMCEAIVHMFHSNPSEEEEKGLPSVHAACGSISNHRQTSASKRS